VVSRRRVVLVFAVLLALGGGAFGPVACREITTFIKIDACLDAGGVWDDAAQRCDR
jgi:hypothetical protein